MNQTKSMQLPDYLFESSWEVCNKVGGIYTVLSTRAFTMQQQFGDKLIFIGPDLWTETNALDFIEDNSLFSDWKAQAAEKDQTSVRIGRWDVPGKPIVILVDFKAFMPEKDRIYYEAWENFQVDSTAAYGDYDESCIFAYASAKVIDSFYRYFHLENKKVTALFNEWMLGMGVLFTRKLTPQVATIFITHATTVGRSIAGNGKALYAYLDGYNGDQMANELNVKAKHAIEKKAAHIADCFTTVSDITATECIQLLDKQPDVVTTNGFEKNFVPTGEEFQTKRQKARELLINIAEKLTGNKIDDDALLISTSGRYEYNNKGINVFIDAINRIRNSGMLKKEAVAFILVPAWTREARGDLKKMVQENINQPMPLQLPFVTHWLHNMGNDQTLAQIEHCGFSNSAHEKMKIIFVPCYLNEQDGIFNTNYYDLLIGMDATVYPSYYEPWGYTPLESIAFGIPTITTNLSGFGLWAKHHISGYNIAEAVRVVERTDFNYFDVTAEIAESILQLSKLETTEKEKVTKNCFELASKAEWSQFISNYYDAFSLSLNNAEKRCKELM